MRVLPRSVEQLRLEESDQEVEEDPERSDAAQPIDPVHWRPPLPISAEQKCTSPTVMAKKPAISATKTISMAYPFLDHSGARRRPWPVGYFAQGRDAVTRVKSMRCLAATESRSQVLRARARRPRHMSSTCPARPWSNPL